MKAGSTIILMLVINLAFCQERLTTILSDNTNAIYFAETIDEVNYLLKINQNGELDVNILNSDQSLTYLHSKVFKGYFTNYEYFIDGDVLHVFDDITPIIYNFVEDKEIRIDIQQLLQE